jgi:hypothetical protein
MKAGDKVNYIGAEFTVLEVDDTTEDVAVHIINEEKEGYCVLLTELMKENVNIS